MDGTKLKNERHDLLFDIRRSVRYHNRRRRFFDRFHLVTNAISVIFGSATIFVVLSALGNGYAVAAAAVVTIFSALDLVVGTSRMARLHDDLYRRFIALEQKVIAVAEEKVTEEDLSQFTSERLAIEADEPPVLRVLDSLCYNELARAMGYGHQDFVKVRWYQRLFSQFVDIGEHRITKQSQRQT